MTGVCDRALEAILRGPQVRPGLFVQRKLCGRESCIRQRVARVDVNGMLEMSDGRGNLMDVEGLETKPPLHGGSIGRQARRVATTD